MLETKRKLIKFSNYSFCLTLPKAAIDQLGWGKGDEVTVFFDEDRQLITISKANQKVPPEPSTNLSNSSRKLRW